MYVKIVSRQERQGFNALASHQRPINGAERVPSRIYPALGGRSDRN